MKFIIASNNRSKREELQRILSDLDIEVVTARDMGFEPIEPEENGVDFAENAYIKALAFSELTGMPVVADDSGLCVDALDGRPGIHSARYGGDHDADGGISLLLHELEGVPHERRTARFVCHMCCLIPTESGELRRLDAEGICEGYIGFEPEGCGGFGFDPVFLTPNGVSFATLSDGEKDAISHRGNALRRLSAMLRDFEGI